MNSAQMDNLLTNLAVRFRQLMQEASSLETQVTGMQTGLAYMQSIGYSNTANPANPGNKSDAQYALDLLGYFNTVAGVWFGTVQQGGTGGTGAAVFNFNNAVSSLWAGQVT